MSLVILLICVQMALGITGSWAVIRYFTHGQWEKWPWGGWHWQKGFDLSWCELTAIVFLNCCVPFAISGNIFWKRRKND